MSRGNPRQQDQSEEETAVLEFLEDNPSFLARYPDLLSRLDIPHLDSGSAVSLVERQVQLLREQGTSLSRQMEDFIAIARENDRLNDRLHHLTLALLDARTLEEALSVSQSNLAELFALDRVILRIAGLDTWTKESAYVADNRSMEALYQNVFSGRVQPRCLSGDALAVVSDWLENGIEIRSCALVPLKIQGLTGILLLGSQEADRFTPEMGTAYLRRLGEMAAKGVERFLD